MRYGAVGRSWSSARKNVKLNPHMTKKRAVKSGSWFGRLHPAVAIRHLQGEEQLARGLRQFPNALASVRHMATVDIDNPASLLWNQSPSVGARIALHWRRRLRCRFLFGGSMENQPPPHLDCPERVSRCNRHRVRHRGLLIRNP